MCYQIKYIGDLILCSWYIKIIQGSNMVDKKCVDVCLKYLGFLVVLTSGKMIVTLAGKVRLDVGRGFMVKK